MDKLTHFNAEGRAKMVDVGGKAVTSRVAAAEGEVRMEPDVLALVRDRALAKGDVLAAAQIAGIMAAKKASELIPMCHPLLLAGIDLSFSVNERESKIVIRAEVKTCGQTGVEMEALTAVSVAALTVYDMCKAASKNMVIGEIRLLSKSGGKSGEYLSS
ncbi:GTP cyclohydrolase subunit MoaC [Syntrophobotulus glycolicus DSM 8271]|uniref:Cyclic pyranopterin monophosphate synthase n=1 Tax=Syntrophobotulus glycolicus (strain DSM 8271 / FlGlyR) TaxID=645991 RepID=F0T0H3_SYNGF|nr:cyclic pyranopterin monophosphate synthase MoaC [Syntrophobotulus glycolicus]ADY57345.1 GTP cyclohydrolase subunit MoaC [Syntrophobotulus glycolicus DSM 8271]